MAEPDRNRLMIAVILGFITDLSRVGQALEKLCSLNSKNDRYDQEMIQREALIAIRQLHTSLERLEAAVEMAVQ